MYSIHILLYDILIIMLAYFPTNKISDRLESI